MKPTPPGWPRMSSAVFYQDAAKAIDWLCKAFGFEVRLKVEGDGGAIMHSELQLGPDGLIMVGSEETPHRPEATHRKSPRSLGGANTQSVMAYVDDVDAHSARAREQGAIITNEPKTTDYGEDYWMDRSYEAVDPEGHHWWFVQRISTGKK
jgi:uncharacterized glyoxalase superfamily protein PhnB